MYVRQFAFLSPEMDIYFAKATENVRIKVQRVHSLFLFLLLSVYIFSLSARRTSALKMRPLPDTHVARFVYLHFRKMN